MKILITGSSGQIGTNLALRLLHGGHEVFGIDKRRNTWTDEFPYLLQDLAGHYAPFPGGINGVEYPETDLVVHLAAHAKVHQLVGSPHRALENAVMTFNVLEYARQANIPIVFSSSREVYGDVHRFEGYNEQAADFAYGEHVLRVEDRGRGVHLLVRALLRAPLPRLPVLERLRPLRQRPPPDPGHPALHPLDAARRADHDLRGRDKTLDFTYVDDCVDGIARGIDALAERRVVNQTINLAYGEGNTLVHCAERIAHELGTEPDMTLAPSLLGEVTHYVADLSKARALLGYDPKVPLDDGIARGRLVPGAPRGTSGGEHVRPRGPRAGPGARPGLEDDARR